MTGNKFVQKSIFLILSNLLTGVLSFLFIVILSRKISSEGMGLYSLIFPICGLLLSVISGGMMVAVSKVVAEYYVKKNYLNIKKCIKTTLIFNLVVAFFIICIAYLFSNQISANIIKDTRTLLPLRLLFISIIFMVLSNTYKGYFYGTTNVSVPAFIDVFEKAIRIILILITFKVFLATSITKTVTITFLIFGIGELISLILFYIYYLLDMRRLNVSQGKVEDRLQLLVNILVISIPLMFTELISSLFFTISTLMVPRRLVVAGFTYSNALSLIGKFSSMSMQIVFFPIIIVSSIAILIVPDLSSSITNREFYQAKRRINAVINVSFIIGILVFIVCMLYGDQLGYLIYKSDDLGSYIKFIACSCPVLYTSITSRSILNGLGKQRKVLKYSFFVSIIQIILLFILVSIPKINIYGVGITLIITTIISLVLCTLEIRRTTKLFDG